MSDGDGEGLAVIELTGDGVVRGGARTILELELRQ
jgi:hypothetical protein